MGISADEFSVAYVPCTYDLKWAAYPLAKAKKSDLVGTDALTIGVHLMSYKFRNHLALILICISNLS